MKKLLGLLMVSLISCNSSTEDKKESYFINKDFKNIVEKIIVNDSMSTMLTISLEDNKSDTEIWIFGFGFFDDCKNVKAIFEYNNRIITLIDNSDYSSYDSLVDFTKINMYENCNTFINKLEKNTLKDYKSFSYLYKGNKLLYLNSSPIEYQNDTVMLEKFIISK